jgi:ABC-type Fe3+-hydroxamate transport system substrate-binding protein
MAEEPDPPVTESTAEGADDPNPGAPLLAHPRVHASWESLAATGREHPRRIVSLVPSLSEALVRLGLGDRLVGVTAYCVHPPGAFDRLLRVGGTKDTDVDAITALEPDLVIANQEENTARVVRRLADREIDVWVTYPRTVGEGVELLAAMAALGASPADRAREVEPARRAYAWACARSARGGQGTPVFCPIWRDPWMTVGSDTYIHDLLRLCGGDNVFAQDGTLGERRYPIVTLSEVAAADPSVILLPDEPYAFADRDLRELGGLDCGASREGRIHLIDGTLVSWYGPRIAQAIQVLAAILARN